MALISSLLTLFLYMRISFSKVIFKPEVISDVINEIKTPFSVIAITCCSSNERLHLHALLAASTQDNGHTVQFLQAEQISSDYIQNHQLVFLLDLNCPKFKESLNMLQKKNLFKSPIKWIFVSNENKSSNIGEIMPEELLDVDILIDTEAMVINKNGKGSYEIYLVYKIDTKSQWYYEYYGSWNETHRFQKLSNFMEVTAMRRLDLRGLEITICYVLTDNDSINHLTDGVRDHIDTITKVNYPTTNQLLDFLNANRKFIFAETWGYRTNDTWNGMTGYLVRGEVEIGGSPMFFTLERSSVVEYISSPTPTRSKFVFQQPKLSYENNIFLLSFRYTVWYSCIAILLLLYVTLFVIAQWEQRKNSYRYDAVVMKGHNSGTLRGNLADIAILIFGATCQQGSPVELKGSLGRVVMLVLFLTLMFLYTSYSANIVALLQSSSSQIKTLEDLLKSRIKFAVHDTVFNRYYFATETEATRKAIYETKVAPAGTTPNFISMDEGVKKMREGLFAFHMETGVGYKFVGKYFEEGQKCALKEIQYLRVMDPWLAVKKNTSYMEMFKIGTKRIQEHGLQKRENHLLYAKRPKCSGREANFVSVSMVDCYPAILVLSYGTLIAILILFTEHLYHKRLNILRALK